MGSEDILAAVSDIVEIMVEELRSARALCKDDQDAGRSAGWAAGYNTGRLDALQHVADLIESRTQPLDYR